MTKCKWQEMSESGEYLRLNGKPLSCGYYLNKWNYCTLPLGHSEQCEYARVHAYGGDDRSMDGPE